MANIGINLVETDGRATPSIQGASTSVAGFIIRSQRGVPDKAQLVTNMAQFLDLYGGYMAPGTGNSAHDKYNGAYAIKGFFDNGGAVAYVVRVFTANAVPAFLNVKDKAQKLNDQDTDPVVVLKISAAYKGQGDPGAWGNLISVKMAVSSETVDNVVTKYLNLTVYYKNRLVETWERIKSTPEGIAKINDESGGSKFIMVEYLVPSKVPMPVADATSLAGGAQDAPDADALKGLCTGALELFDTLNVQLLACPECCNTAFITSAMKSCSTAGDRIFVTDTGDIAFTQAKALISDRNQYGAVYWPHIRVDDPLGLTRWIPPTGHVMGVMARTERERGIWKAPAGVGAQVRGALDVKYHISDTDHTELVKVSGVNAVRFVAGQGIIVDSARTLSTSVLWQFLNVRLLFNFVKSSLKGGLRWAVYEPNDEVLWNKVTHNAVRPFLMNLWRRGPFGPGAPEEVFSVKCDMENNTPDNIQQGILNVEVYFYPSRPAETFILTVGQQEGGPSASES